MTSESSQHSKLVWERIVWRDPERMSGALCFRGTRVPVRTLTDYLKGGHSLDDFIEGFPSVKRAQAEQFMELSTQLVEERASPA